MSPPFKTMNVKDHYDKHLGNFYSWMIGDFNTKQFEQEVFFRSLNLTPIATKIAFDLGAGHGLQSVSLAKLGYTVKAVDFNKQLLEQLKINQGDLAIDRIENDLLTFLRRQTDKADVIVCMGDTLTHLQHPEDVKELVTLCARHLIENGKLIFSFRDFSKALQGTNRFIPVKQDDDKILTCFLEYFQDHVMVHDILHEKENGVWQQKISAYPKLIVNAKHIMDLFSANGIAIENSTIINRMVYITGRKS